MPNICPICKNPVLDGARFCSFCGNSIAPQQTAVQRTVYPSADEPTIPVQNPQNYHSSSAPHESYEDQSIPHWQNDSAAPAEQSNEQPIAVAVRRKKSKAPLIIIIIVLLLLITGGIVFLFFIMPSMNEFKVESVTTSSWEKDGDLYKMTVTSEQTKPFLSFFNVTDDEGKKSVDFVMLDNGKGTIKKLNDKYKYSAYGYCKADAITENDLSSIYTSYDFDKYTIDGFYTCSVTFEFTLNDSRSGWLIFDTTNTKDKGINTNYKAIVSNGKGKGSLFITFDEVPDRNKFSATFLPKYFIDSQEIEQGSGYKLVSDFSIEKNNYQYLKEICYSGKQEVSFDSEYSDGFVLYTYEMKSGGIADDVGKVEYRYSMIESGSATLTTYDIYKNSQYPKEPTYDLKVIGIIIPKSIGGALQEKTTDSANILDSLYNTAESSKAAEINFKKIVKDNADGDTYYCKVANDGSYLEVDSNPLDLDDHYSADAVQYIKNINIALGFTDSLYKKMSRTRALDGTQHDENDKIKVSWSYHPNNGLEVIYEKK